MHVSSEETGQAISSYKQVNETIIDIHKAKDAENNPWKDSFPIFIGVDKVLNAVDNGRSANCNSVNIKCKTTIDQHENHENTSYEQNEDDKDLLE